MNTQQAGPESVLVKRQRAKFGPKVYLKNGVKYRIVAEVRYDDDCGNGHNTFSITGHTERHEAGRWREDSCGCIHDEIAKHFPELAPLIKWHLCSSDGPLHYVANTVYLAGDRDCHGLRKGEFRQHTSRGKVQNGGVEGVPNWELERPAVCDVYAAEKPAAVVLEWKPSGVTGEGKAREFDAARRTAIWPDATDAELCAPDLKEKLEARLPALLVEFRAAVEGLGFTW